MKSCYNKHCDIKDFLSRLFKDMDYDNVEMQAIVRFLDYLLCK